MNENEMIQNSMDIILHAGNARKFTMIALDYATKFDFENSNAEMEKAEKEIVQAHRVQTNSIQGEMQGETVNYSILFAHAQDTLMTIYSEINIAKKLISFSKQIDERFKELGR